MKGGRLATSLGATAGLVVAVVSVVVVWAGPTAGPEVVVAVGGPSLRPPSTTDEPDRSSAAGQGPSALAPSIAAPPAPAEPAADCPWTDADRDLVGAEGHQRIVEFAYCSLLSRAPDPEGRDYWEQQLGAGLSVGELVQQVASSNEYRSRRPGRDRWDDSPLGALAAVVPLAASRPAAEQAVAPPTTVQPAPPIDDGFLARQPIAASEFDRWIGERGLGDVDRVTGALIHDRIEGERQQINVVYVHRSATQGLRVSPGDRGRATVGTWASEIGADVAINGNWYAPWDGPAVSGGQVYGGSDHGYTALFGVTVEGDVVLQHHREINDGVDSRVVEGVSGHPTLIHRGQRTTDFGTDPAFLNRHPRTVIGLDATADILILVTVDGRSSQARGMTGDETARLMEDLGAHDAVMLDGGGSTTMWIAGRGVVNRPSGAVRAVGNEIAVFGR